MHLIKNTIGSKAAACLTIGVISTAMTTLPTNAQIQVPQGTIGVQPVAGRTVSVKNNTLVVAFNLGTCVDKLLPPTYATEKRGRNLYVYVSGLNARQNAAAVLCTPGPYVAQAKLTIPSGYSLKRIQLVNINQLGTP